LALLSLTCCFCCTFSGRADGAKRWPVEDRPVPPPQTYENGFKT
jgi:hypothetical protein